VVYLFVCVCVVAQITGLILITLAFLTSLLLLLMYKAMWYDKLTCPEGFILKVSSINTHTHTHTHTHTDAHTWISMIMGEKYNLPEVTHVLVSSFHSTDFLFHYPGRSSLCVIHSKATYTVYAAAGALFLGTREDSLKTGAGNPNSLSPNDTLEASCSEPPLPRMLVKEPVSHKKGERERRREPQSPVSGQAEIGMPVNRRGL